MEQNNTGQPIGQPAQPVVPGQPMTPVTPTQPTDVAAPVEVAAPAGTPAPVGISDSAQAAQPVPPVALPTPPVASPVPPVVAPAQPAQPTQLGANPMPEIPTPVAPVFNPTGANVGTGGVGTLSATEAIMQPEPAPEPDPVEEELKAPFKAADPVPGSIGSAVSMPADASNPGQTPSVAFNDPATAPEQNPSIQGAPVKMKKKMDKRTLTMIAILGGMVAVALAVVLVIMLMPSGQ